MLVTGVLQVGDKCLRSLCFKPTADSEEAWTKGSMERTVQENTL